MSVSHRFLRRTVLSLLYMLPGICAAQTNQFLNIPAVQLTNGRVSSFLTGAFQSPPSFTDMLWINTPVGSGTSTSVTVGEELNQGGSGFDNHGQNEIIFTKVAHVVAALADFDGDGNLDYAFALTPTVAGTTNLCVYYGTGATALSGESSYSGPIGSPANAYPPTGGKSGCMTFPVSGNNPPYFSQIVAFPFKVGFAQQELMIEDSANNLLYIFKGDGATGANGVLQGFTLINTITLPSADGAGPIYVGDFNDDGNTDFIVNGQTGNSATVYLGNGDGTFQPPLRLHLRPQRALPADAGHERRRHPGHGGRRRQRCHRDISGHRHNRQPLRTPSIGGTPAGVDGLYRQRRPPCRYRSHHRSTSSPPRPLA